MIPKETVETIIETARIEEVVGDFVSLKRRGVNLIGICPFHNEKTPSFTVSPVKGIFKCFGCAKAGNSVNFIMEHEHYTYPEALKYLARKYNIAIEEDEAEISPEQQQAINEKESLFIVSAFAQKFFTDKLLSSDEGKSIGRSYFKERGFRSDIIEKFQLGYSPENRRALAEAAKEQGYNHEYLAKAGLLIIPEPSPSEEKAGERSPFDRFAGRVMFPIHNLSGRVIAFGGRTLKTDKKVAKYINSPETDIYHKSNVLYGLHFAKKSIISHDNCYLVEGYTDVISLHQAGIENVVASSGTSLTTEQIRLIKRYTPNITILYDGDAAGIKASFRGIDLILEEGMNVKVVLFPDGEDPDSFAKKHPEQEIREFINANAKDFIRFKTSLLLSDAENDPIKKAGLIREIISSIALIDDNITRSVYIKDCGRLLDVAEATLVNELNRLRRNKVRKEAPQEESSYAPEPGDAAEHQPVEDNNTTLYQEKEIIRLLLNYGKRQLSIKSINEKGEEEAIAVSVAEFIIHSLRVEDHIEFRHPIYAQVFEEFCRLFRGQDIPDENYFFHHEHREMREAAIDTLTSPYALSEGWEKNHIIVQTEEADLARAVYNAVYSLKLKKVMELEQQNDLQLKELKPDDDIMPLMQERNNLITAKKALSAHLGRIVVK